MSEKELKELGFADKGHHYELLYKGLNIHFHRGDSRLFCRFQTYTARLGKNWIDLGLYVNSFQELKEVLEHVKKITDKMIV